MIAVLHMILPPSSLLYTSCSFSSSYSKNKLCSYLPYDDTFYFVIKETFKWHVTYPGWPGKLVTPLKFAMDESCSVVSSSWWLHGLYSPWNSLGQNTRVGNHCLLPGIFPTQGLNPVLLHCRQILYQLSHKGSPRILDWVAYPFSSGSSWPRNWTGVSCIAGRFFTNWAIREA